MFRLFRQLAYLSFLGLGFLLLIGPLLHLLGLLVLLALVGGVVWTGIRLTEVILRPGPWPEHELVLRGLRRMGVEMDGLRYRLWQRAVWLYDRAVFLAGLLCEVVCAALVGG